MSEALQHYARGRDIGAGKVRQLSLPDFPPNTAPDNGRMAMDDGLANNFDYVMGGVMDVVGDPTRLGGIGFPGFPALSAYAQVPEYRKISDIYARDATRKWINFEAVGEQDKTDKIAKLTAIIEKMRLKEEFYKAALYDGLFGRGHLYIDTGERDDSKELRLTIGDGVNWSTKNKIGLGSIKGVRAIEPVWCMPANYESTNPLRKGFYEPTSWYCQGVEVHSTRLLAVVSKPVPQMFQPAYAFSGMSWTELAKPYVDRWLRAAKSVSNLVHSFSVSVFGTNMDAVSANGSASEEMLKRLRVYADMRDNRDVFVLNNDPTAPETFQTVNIPLSGLDKLQAQSLEHVCSVTSIPLILYTGISPSGLNASAEPELEAWNTTVLAFQESALSPALKTIINMLQLSLFGEIDPGITFTWESLSDMSPRDKAELRELDARTGEILVRNGAVSRLEERTRVAADPDAPYASLDLSKPATLLPTEKAEIAAKVASAVAEIQATSLVSDAVCLQELKNSSLTTGLWSSISDLDIAVADQDPPDPNEGLMPGMPGQPGMGAAAPGAPGLRPTSPNNGKPGAPPPFKAPAGMTTH
jgi:phage-related protein (TIGR01555 family)